MKRMDTGKHRKWLVKLKAKEQAIQVSWKKCSGAKESEKMLAKAVYGE